MKGTTIQNIYNLTPLQEGMLFHHLHTPGNDPYIIQHKMNMEGSLSPEILRNSLRGLIEIHDMLRASIVYREVNRPRMVILEKKQESFRFVDLSHLTEAEQHRRLDGLMEKERREGLDLTRDSLFQMTLCKRSENEHVLLITHHHIIVDGWSLGILFRDLLEMYQRLSAGQPHAPAREQHYNKYADWLNRLDRDQSLAFWQTYLHGYDTATLLPQKRLKQSEAYRPEISTLRLDRAATGSIVSLARASGVTVNTWLQCVWAIVLQRYNDADEAVFGAVISGRPAEVSGIEEMVGLFINTVPVRIKTHKGQTLQQMALQVQQQFRECERNGYLSLTEIKEAAGVQVPLFDNVMIFENYPLDESLRQHDVSDIVSFRISEVEGFEHTNYDLNLYISQGDEIMIELVYNASAWSAYYIEQIKGHLNQVIEEAVRQPHIEVEQIQILTEQEEHLLLHAVNDTACAMPAASSFLHSLDDMARSCPDRPAVLFGTRCLTYRELDRDSNRLAHYLLQQGLRKGTFVGIYMDRSLEMAVGILAILKAGLAYIPLDPSFPAERLDYMIREADIDTVLTQQNLIHLPMSGVKNRICLDSEHNHWNDFPDAKPDVHIQGTDTAYMIYTSGSTGYPKGVQIQHEALHNFLLAMSKKPGLSAHERLLSVTTISFDIFYLELFLPLTQGGTVLLASQQDAANGQALIDYLDKYDITMMQATPSTWKLMIESGWKGKQDLKILCGGEPLSSLLAEQLLQRSKELWNMYGPTETTIWSSVSPIESVNDITIGRPIDNTRFYVLDASLRPVPVGVPGQLYIGGTGLANGYWQDRAKTEDKFIMHRFKSIEQAQRLYRTGDMVKVTPELQFQYLNRADAQVKLRGYRIETQEIEHHLQQAPHVEQAIVILRENPDRDPFLAAYFTANKEIDHASLREHLLVRIPVYMLPSHFVQVDQFPLTPNGKVDRNALPDPSAQAIAQHELPDGDVATFLYEVWSGVLQRTDIRASDNFFQLGGNSILLIQVLNQINTRYAFVAINDLFIYTTISDLAKYIVDEHNASTVELIPTVSLPGAYFVGEHPDRRDQAADLTVSLPEPVRLRLSELAKEHGVEVQDILYTLFTYLLAEASGTQEISIYFIHNDRLKPLVISYEEVHSQAQLYPLIHTLRRRAEQTGGSELKQLAYAQILRKQHHILPLIYYKEDMYTNVRLLDFADFILEIDGGVQEDMTLTFPYKVRTFAYDKFQYLVDLYLKLAASL